MAIKCIEYDISIMDSLIQLDPENPYSKSYFSNYDNFSIFYKETLYKNETDLLDPKINYREQEHYFTNENYFKIEQKQYDYLYIFVAIIKKYIVI